MNSIANQKILDILNDPRLDLSGFQFSEQTIGRFQRFLEVLDKWNGKINLVSEKDASLILKKHVFDSLQYLRWLEPSHKTLDIGSGAGLFTTTPLLGARMVTSSSATPRVTILWI